MSVTFDEVILYARQAGQDECARLAKIFREYSQIPPLFRDTWDMYKTLPEERKKIADRVMESSLKTIYELSTL